MFSGKTTELIRKIIRFQIAKKKCIVIKYLNDTRYSKNHIVTHNGIKFNAIISDNLNKLTNIEQYDVIGIDEGQFFPNLASFCDNMAKMNKIVIVSALSGTYDRKIFKPVSELIPYVNELKNLTAICSKCYRSASFSKRLSNNKQLEYIGGGDKYMAVCRKCYFI